MTERGNRVYLRSVTPDDRSEFLSLMIASRKLHEPWISPPLTPDVFDFYLERCARDDHEGWLVCSCRDDAITGVININNIVRGSFLSASLGYYVGLPYSGNGYMKEGLTLLVRKCFEQAGLHRLEANIQPSNFPSIALVKHCGFVSEGLAEKFLFIDGQWRDHERWVKIHDRATLHHTRQAEENHSEAENYSG